MKKYLKYTLLIAIVLFSFYFTEKQATFFKNNDPLLKSIKEYQSTHELKPVNAVINDNYITPGLYGKRVNEIKSLMKMKSDGIFNSIFLVMDNIKPDISINNNKDKIINKGNEGKQAISFILEDDESNIITYLIANKIDASLLVNKNSINANPYFEQINNDFEYYDKVEKILNKNKNNTNICLIGRNNKNFCLRHKKYLVEPTQILSSSNLITVKNKLSSGDIILIKNSVFVDDLSYLIQYIKSKDLKIIKLSELIDEKQR